MLYILKPDQPFKLFTSLAQRVSLVLEAISLVSANTVPWKSKLNPASTQRNKVRRQNDNWTSINKRHPSSGVKMVVNDCCWLCIKNSVDPGCW